MKKSSKEKRAMEPTINGTGRSEESVKIFSLMRAIIKKQLQKKIKFGYLLFSKLK